MGAGIDWCARKSGTEYEYDIGCVHHHGCRTTVTTLQKKRVLSGVVRVELGRTRRSAPSHNTVDWCSEGGGEDRGIGRTAGAVKGGRG